MYYCYMRVSTKEQNLDRQVTSLTEYCKKNNFNNCKYYGDYESGKNFNRKNYQALKKKLKSGDTLIIHSIDRLGRNYEQIIDEWRWFETHNIDIIVLDMPILSTHCEGLDMRFLSNLVLQVLSYVAQKEREQIKKRQREGIDIAMAKGVKFGRPKKDYNIEIIKEYLRYRQNADYYIELSGVSRATFYRLCKEYESNVSIQEQ